MSLDVAKEILNQLGKNRFAAMTGAKKFVGSPNSLSFRLPGAGGFCKDGINVVHITLDPSDTYTIVFSRLRAGKLKTIATVSDVYADMLRTIFTTYTGLRTSL